MKRQCSLSALAGALLLLGCEKTQRAGGLDVMRTEVMLTPQQVQWQPAPGAVPGGAQVAVLEGDPEANEPFVIRLRMPDGYRFPAHSHPHTERVTVIQGTMHLGMADRFDMSAARAFPAGSFVAIPAGQPHFVLAEGETIIQVTGVGPLGVDYVRPEDDPRGN